MFAMVNELRASVGVAQLRPNGQLAYVAHTYSTGSLPATWAHNPHAGEQIPAGWRIWGENLSNSSTTSDAGSRPGSDHLLRPRAGSLLRQALALAGQLGQPPRVRVVLAVQAGIQRGEQLHRLRRVTVRAALAASAAVSENSSAPSDPAPGPGATRFQRGIGAATTTVAAQRSREGPGKPLALRPQAPCAPDLPARG